MNLINEAQDVAKYDTLSRINRSPELSAWLAEVRLSYSGRDSHKISTAESAETLARFESLLGPCPEVPRGLDRDALRNGEDVFLAQTEESGSRWLKNLRAQSYLEGMRLALTDSAVGASVAFAWNALAMTSFVEEQLAKPGRGETKTPKNTAQAGDSPRPITD